MLNLMHVYVYGLVKYYNYFKIITFIIVLKYG